jgi:hypothetical protein
VVGAGVGAAPAAVGAPEEGATVVATTATCTSSLESEEEEDDDADDDEDEDEDDDESESEPGSSLASVGMTLFGASPSPIS